MHTNRHPLRRGEPTLLLLGLGLAAACGGFGCGAGEVEPLTSDVVDLVLYTTQCPPETEPETHFHTEAAAPLTTLTLRWDLRCVRDQSEIQWWAVRVSHWDDRAEDIWNVWYLDPELREVRYGKAQIPGGVDINNTDYPYAMEKVPPQALPPGDYRVEVWGILVEYLDSQWSEVRLTVEE